MRRVRGRSRTCTDAHSLPFLRRARLERVHVPRRGDTAAGTRPTRGCRRVLPVRVSEEGSGRPARGAVVSRAGLLFLAVRAARHPHPRDPGGQTRQAAGACVIVTDLEHKTPEARCRLPQGGLIDRRQPLSFEFDGRRYGGYRGDTLASALLASGVRLVGSSFKYHRPRGVLTAGSEEPNALVEL